MAWFRRNRPPARFARTGFAETTLAELAWQRTRTSAHRWGAAGALIGALVALVAFIPAGWVAGAVASASGQRVLLADARGTVWNGSALLVFTGGPGSRDATALPDRLEWRLGLAGLLPELRLRQACCMRGEVRAVQSARLGPAEAVIAAGARRTRPVAGQWLAGLGAPRSTPCDWAASCG
jgi:general secretion pathway protein N